MPKSSKAVRTKPAKPRPDLPKLQNSIWLAVSIWPKWKREKAIVAPQFGPGTELHNLFFELGFKPEMSCDCQWWIDRMNAWGRDGCRLHLQEIIAHMGSQKDAAALTTKLKAAAIGLGCAALGVFSAGKSLPLTAEGLVDEAIRRAANKT